MLLARPGDVMDNLIFNNQSTFIKGRFLVDRVVVVNGLAELDKKTKNSCLIFMVDFEMYMIQLVGLFLII